jgi:anti-anti-sigma factor
MHRVGERMEIEQKIVGNVTILTLVGEFDERGYRPAVAKIDAVIDLGCHSLIVNVRRLSSICASALGYLIRTERRVRELRGEMVLSRPSAYFQSTITTLGIDETFRIFPTDDEALAALEKRS